MIAGVFGLEGDLDGPDALARKLEGCWQSQSGDRFQVVHGDGFVAAHLMLPGHAGTCESVNGISILLAGEPMSGNVAVADVLGEQSRGNWIGDAGWPLGAWEGEFAIVQAEPAKRHLRLAVDKLGLRSLYYGIDRGVVFFATSMRALLHLCPSLRTCADIAGQSQQVALGYCLGARTPYAAVRVVEPAQMVEFQHGQRSASYYFDWSGIEPFRGTQKEFARALHRAFLDGVARRASGEDASVAYLSGGLDSRCLTAALLTLGKPVSTINYAPAGSQDLVLGRLAAEKLGTRHLEFPRGALDFRDRGVESYLAWQASQAAHDLRPAPMRVWAGFAGETVLAPTNISEAAAAALSKQDLLGAIAAFLARAGTAPSGWLIKSVWRTTLSEELSQSVAAEVERHDIADPHRRFHTFLVLNEPRGMLSRHFEELDERRLRYILPFLDTRFVALALSAPLEWLLRHRFYYRWLDEFQEAVRSVPWQAYPWSLPCPLQVPLGLRRQWDEDWFTAAERREEEERLMARVRCDLRRAAFPSQILNRMAIMAAYGLARIGVRRYLYMLRVARAFVQISADIYE